MTRALSAELDDSPARECTAQDADGHDVGVAELGEMDAVAEDVGYSPVPGHLPADRCVDRGNRAAL